MAEKPASYVLAALTSLGINCLHLDIEGYDPQFFGNFGAIAKTDIGTLRIVYDREFWVEAEQPLPTHLTEQAIASALDQAVRDESNVSEPPNCRPAS